MKIKANISISRLSDNMVKLTLTDEASLITFVDMRISMNNYALIITGLSHVEAEGEVRGLEHVGKLKARESRRVVCPLNTYDRSALQEWLVATQAEEGWIIDAYLGSQNSIKREGDNLVLNYAVYKYVEHVTP